MKEEIDELINTYNSVVKVVDTDAKSEDDRAYGGVVRSVKGKLQEHLDKKRIQLAIDFIATDLSQYLPKEI